MKIEDRIKQIILNKYRSIRAFTIAIGMPYSTFDSILQRGIENASITNIIRICKELDLDVDALASGEIASKQAKKIDDGNIFNIIKNKKEAAEIKKVPLLGTIAAGLPILAEENVESYLPVLSSCNVDFALRIKGDSMIGARIYDGDIVYIKSQNDVEDGEIAAVLIDNEATLKRVYKFNDAVHLNPSNPEYKPMIYTKNNCQYFKILGKAVFFNGLIN